MLWHLHGNIVLNTTVLNDFCRDIFPYREECHDKSLRKE